MESLGFTKTVSGLPYRVPCLYRVKLRNNTKPGYQF
jgi:hypothetical protein